MKHGFVAAAVGVVALSALLGCGGTDPGVSTGGSQVAVYVAALDYAEFDTATYTIETFYRDDDGVMKLLTSKAGFDANGPRGALTYIAPCLAAADGPRLGQIRITITDLWDAAGLRLDDLVLPPSQTKQFLCAEEQDTPVAFEFTVVRSSNIGFADVVVDIDDIYCAAKIDCQPDLYPDEETGVMGPALVFGLACTGGDDVALGDNLLAFSFDTDPTVACPGLTAAGATFTGYQTIGNQAFWNTILPLTGDETGEPCVLDASGMLYDRKSPTRPALFQTGAAVIDFHIALDGAGNCDAAGPPEVEAIYAQLAGVHAFDGEAPATKDAPVGFQTFEVRAVDVGAVSGHEVRTLTTAFPGGDIQSSAAWTFVVGDGEAGVSTELLTACALPGEDHTWSTLLLVMVEPAGNTPLGAVKLDYDPATGDWTCAGGELPDGGRYCAVEAGDGSDVPCFPGFVTGGDGAFIPPGTNGP
ncbi:MAG: hypothetical protein CVU56_26485 [Deltaproteobacteria bacterium HGW-Deltaproteobacteria-14]|jgi:hypothetical protein|nr:MAG: hypothetical protein CVU56_26485 [Deltaproteobacteria bacterium HGW-Deltaproteobacteria-14]